MHVSIDYSGEAPIMRAALMLDELGPAEEDSRAGLVPESPRYEVWDVFPDEEAARPTGPNEPGTSNQGASAAGAYLAGIKQGGARTRRYFVYIYLWISFESVTPEPLFHATVMWKNKEAKERHAYRIDSADDDPSDLGPVVDDWGPPRRLNRDTATSRLARYIENLAM